MLARDACVLARDVAPRSGQLERVGGQLVRVGGQLVRVGASLLAYVVVALLTPARPEIVPSDVEPTPEAELVPATAP